MPWGWIVVWLVGFLIVERIHDHGERINYGHGTKPFRFFVLLATWPLLLLVVGVKIMRRK